MKEKEKKNPCDGAQPSEHKLDNRNGSGIFQSMKSNLATHIYFRF